VPVIEDDTYFDALLGTDHPLPSLPAPPGCARPNTTARHASVRAASHCTGVWQSLGPLVNDMLIPNFESIQERVSKWWLRHKTRLMERIANLLQHARALHHCGHKPKNHNMHGTRSGEMVHQVDKRSEEQAHLLAAASDLASSSAHLGGTERDRNHDSLDQTEECRLEHNRERATHVKAAPTQTSPARSCAHHDLRCLARQAQDAVADQGLHHNIAEARAAVWLAS
jgi:hypothetical protein